MQRVEIKLFRDGGIVVLKHIIQLGPIKIISWENYYGFSWTFSQLLITWLNYLKSSFFNGFVPFFAFYVGSCSTDCALESILNVTWMEFLLRKKDNKNEIVTYLYFCTVCFFYTMDLSNSRSTATTCRARTPFVCMPSVKRNYI